jgi:plastocyanin
MRTMRRSVWLFVLLGAAGCATAAVERAAQPLAAGGQAVTVETIRFTFLPDVVTLKAGEPITITAVSKSRIPHNITILSLEGQVLKDVDIGRNRTEVFQVTLPAPGRYVFYCANFLHRRPFGMEGALVAR